jgi:ribosomal protein L7Ae-like RNA K-turn-binding protein
MDKENCQIVVGKKQILRLTKENELKKIQIASDADADYVQSIMTLARAHNVSVEISGTKEEISRQYGIDVPSGGVGFLKD